MKLLIAFLLSASLALAQEEAAAGSGPIVSTYFGKVKGATGQGRDGKMYYSFKGIPYGKADRFAFPQMPDMWEGVKDATKNTHCIQYFPVSREIVGEENCLRLNIFTPKLPVEGQDKILLPVVVYLHAGLNSFGGAEEYEPYMDGGSGIVVLPNFRQGPFGFLSTHDKEAQGNFGIRDQVQALEWVKQNIEKFGGDKDSVTIIGSGSGGADAFLHTISPKSKDLIHKVAAMGGATLSRFTIISNPVKHAKRLGNQLGCPVDSSAALLTCLKGKDAKEILQKMVKLDPKTINVEDVAWFGPTVDKLLEGQTESDLVVPDNPVKLLKEGKISNKVPAILGVNEFGGVNPATAELLKNETLLERLNTKFDEVAPSIFLYKDSTTPEDAKEITKKIREFYFGDKPISKETFLNYTNLFMDRFIGFGLVATGKLYSQHAPVYLYYFSGKPETTGLKFLGLGDTNLGMTHLDDVQYFFKLNIDKIPFPEITKEHKEYQLSKDLLKLFGSFAETGKPTKTWGEGKEWKQIPAGNPSIWYKLGMYTALHDPVPESFAKRIGFWDELYKTKLAKETLTPEVEPF